MTDRNMSEYEQLQADASLIARNVLSHKDLYVKGISGETLEKFAKAWALMAKEEFLSCQRADSAQMDADRYRTLREETTRVDPLLSVVAKLGWNRNESQWVNVVTLDDAIDRVRTLLCIPSASSER